MRSRRLLYNTVSSLIFQITTIICGFILPRLVLQHFGSEVNGLVKSVNQFLGIIAFLELGVGAVVQSSLYKPLATKNNEAISKIIASGEKFFKKLAHILLVYIFVLICIYPYIANQNFGWVYTATLIATISISLFSQYYFGVVDRLLLTADQRGYIHYTTQTITLLINTVACVLLIKIFPSIHIVKLTTSLIYLFRPIFLRWYVNKHYDINRKTSYTQEPIKQKWNGVAQHVAAVVLDGTDNIVLTIFSTLSNVSIYSVYHLVIFGVKQLFMSMTNGMQALIGELWAKQESDNLLKTFGWFEWLIHTLAVFVFGCTGVLIIPFVQVYTLGITDANYVQPLFAIIITIAHAGHCLRLPYSIMILAAGHYKQTQNFYIIAAIINIVVSVITVNIWGLVGVALGTLAAMSFHTIWMSLYTSKYLIKWPFKNFIKQIIVDAITVFIGVGLSSFIPLQPTSYISWLVCAIEVALVWIVTLLLINMILYRKELLKLIYKCRL